jgi:PST family polysaccharide transporter
MKAYFDDHRPGADLGRQSIRGSAFSVVARAISGLVQLGSVLILARLLTPEDYGLVAMAVAVTGFAPILVDLGTRDAVVQRSRIREGEVSALFWITVAVGGIFALLVSMIGPLIAWFYDEPRLTVIALLLSLTFVASALMSQHQALMRRAGMFREFAIVDVAANVLSAGTAIAMAYSGWQYLALATRPVALYFFMAVGVWLYCPWLPAKPSITSGVRDMIKFGMHLTGSLLINYAGRNGDRVAIGRSLGAQTLGYYQSSMLFYDHLLGLLVGPLHPIAVASLSKLQNDAAQLKKSWAKALSTVAFYAMPAFGLLAVLSQDLIVGLLGSKWANAGTLLSILALRGIPHAAEQTLGWLHVAAGRTDRWLRSGIAVNCGQLLALFLGLRFGTTGVVCAYVLFMYLAFIPTLAYAGHPLGIGARDVIRAVGAQLTGALAAAGLGFALRFSLLDGASSTERMAMLLVVYLLTYLIVVVGWFKVTTPVLVCLSLIRDFLPGRLKPIANLGLAGPGK